MTVKLYESNGLLLDFSATITDAREKNGAYQVALDKTAFAPNAGGQSADIGKLDGIDVLDVREENGILWHTVSAPLAVGQSVTGKVDAALRWHHLQNHAGEHIISALLHREFGFTNVGFHLGDEVVTLDTDGAISMAGLLQIEETANEIVAQNCPIICYYPKTEELADLAYRSKLDLKENVRIVEIEGVDLCACCAPHPATTAQIGVIKILTAMPYKGGTRITMICGKSALRLWNEERDRLGNLSNLLSLPRERVCEGVENLLEKQNQYKASLHAMAQRQMARLAKIATETETHQAWFLPTEDESAAREFGKDLLAKTDVSAVFYQTANAYRVILQKRPEADFDAKAWFAALGVKGGGKGELFQGSCQKEKADLLAMFENGRWTCYDQA